MVLSDPRIVSRLVWALCALGALRVLAFALAYPVFAHSDEPLHFDVIVKYAQHGRPVRYDYDAIAVPAVAKYGMPGSSARMSPPREGAEFAEATRIISGYLNCETYAPPAYYVLAAVWYRIGQLLGLGDFGLLYWLRFLNAPLYLATMWLACRLCLGFHRPALAIGVGLLLAVLPQDILYTINSDALSPLLVVMTLYLLLRWLGRERAVLLAAAAGVAAAGAMLAKYSNVGVLLAVVVAAIFARRRTREVAVLLLCAAAPVALWMLYCHTVLGDWTGTRDKIAMLGWTPLPLAQSLQHPIFGVGVVDFTGRLTTTFWRGELAWGPSVQRWVPADYFYLIASALGLLGAAGWLLRPSDAARAERRPALLYAAAVVGSVLFLALISARFDYGRCAFPSQRFPYFAAGRLLSGMLAPFAILLIGGAEELRRRFGLVLAVLAAIVCIASELYLCADIFASPQNWYHVVR